ncbi:MAG: hypothetical protein GY851_27540 [bacterium]|nr:hypothetical protein [bacterium]
MARRLGALCFVMLFVVIPGARAASSACCNAASAPLDMPVAEFGVEGVDMARFFSAFVHLTGVTGGLVVNTVPFDDDGKPMRHVSMIAIQRTNVTARELLDEAVRQAPEYTWRGWGPTQVLVLPVREVRDPEAFANAPAGAFPKEELSLDRAVGRLSRMAKDTDHPIGQLLFVGYATSADAERPVTFADTDKTMLDVLARAFSSAGEDLVWVLHWNVVSCMKVRGGKIVSQALVEAESAAVQPDAAWEPVLSMLTKALAQTRYPATRTAVEYRVADVLAAGPFSRDGVHASLMGLLSATERPACLTDAVLVHWLLVCEVAESPESTKANLLQRLESAPAHDGYRAALQAGIAWLEFAITDKRNVNPAP